MRRFFIILFVVSVSATAAAYYWRTYQPEQTVVASAPNAVDDSGITTENHSFSRRSLAPEAFSPQTTPVVTRQQPSDRQDLAMMISLVSSVISALAAIFQTWLTARSIRSRV